MGDREWVLALGWGLGWGCLTRGLSVELEELLFHREARATEVGQPAQGGGLQLSGH